jgi:hypothetical protein
MLLDTTDVLKTNERRRLSKYNYLAAEMKLIFWTILPASCMVGKRGFGEPMQHSYRMFAGIVVLAAGIAQAQFGPEGRYRPESVSALIGRVHEDLNRGYAVWHLRGGDRERFNRAEHQLRDFAEHWRHGRFDKGNLDGAIGAIQRVLNDNHLRGGERDALWADIGELRRMREAYDRHEIGRR